jgi:hypothetical protein
MAAHFTTNLRGKSDSTQDANRRIGRLCASEPSKLAPEEWEAAVHSR